MTDTSDLQTNFRLSEEQSRGIMEDAKRLAARTQEWLNAGGREQLAETQCRAEAAAKAIEEALRPDPETLSKPMTI